MLRASIAIMMALLPLVASPAADACKVKGAKARRVAIRRPASEKPVTPPAAEPAEASTPAPVEAKPAEKPAEPKTVETKPAETPAEPATPPSDEKVATPAPKHGGKLVPEVAFGRGQAALNDGTKKKLDQVASFLLASPDVRITIEGHADSSGSADANQTLSEHRADAVKAYLESKGVPADRLSTAAFGDTKPKYAPASPKNRRAALVQQ